MPDCVALYLDYQNVHLTGRDRFAPGSRRTPESSTALALGLALLGRPQDRIRPLTCGAKGTRTPGLLDANQTLFQLSYSPGSASRSGYPVRDCAATGERAREGHHCPFGMIGLLI